MREVRAAGHEALLLTTALLQRVRRADREAGTWEAADVQWWWRQPRLSDGIEQIFWVDDQAPVAGVLLTSWPESVWHCDPILVPGVPGIQPALVWARAWKQVGRHVVGEVEVPVRDDDRALRKLVLSSGLVPGKRDRTAWMEAADRPRVRLPAEGCVLFDRTQRTDTPHPMRQRNGADVAARLGQCSLYDPALDLAMETVDGRVVGYSLYWFDPVTEVGLVEPVRVEDEHQRLVLARAMLTAGIDRLAAQGARRVKISFESEAAAALYQGVGFRMTSSDAWYAGRVPGN